MEKHHESAYRCSRVGHADCEPDLRSDCAHRQQSDLWRLRLGTKLALLWFQSITPLGRGLRFKPTRWLDYAAGPCAGRLRKVRALLEMKVLGKVRITSIAAAALLASPAFAAPPFAQPVQVERIDDQRVITEVVVNGHLIEGADEAPANELRPVPNWIDGSGALDPARRHSY